MSSRINAICIVIALIVTQGCDRDKVRPHEALNSVLWSQTAVEHDVACVQTFRAAAAAVEQALSEPNWTASLEQTNEYQQLPPAVIVDVDETVLDNTPFQAQLVMEGKTFDMKDWQVWVNEARAQPLPGAVEFIGLLKQNGVQVFYVTNRSLKEPTVRNIQAVLDPEVSAEQVLCKYEREGWGSDKSSRRAVIAQTHRILALLGDDYNDFVFLGKGGLAERNWKATAHSELWGTKWFLLPNAMYGHWEGVLYQYDYDLDYSAVLKTKINALIP